MAMSAGSVHVDLSARLDRSQFDAYERKLNEIKAKAARKEQFQARLGADYDNRAFNAFERDLARASTSTRKTDRDVHVLSAGFRGLRVATSALPRALTGVSSGLVGVADSAAKAGANIGGAGGGLVGGMGALAAGAGGLAAILGTVGALMISVAGAATALAGSLSAAAAGAAAIGVGFGAALGPLAALGAAVGQRFGVISEAYKALGDVQEKGGAQATSTAKAQDAAAQQVAGAERSLADAQRTVRGAQEDLTDARFKARREVEDLANAVKHAALEEEGASISLAEARNRLIETREDPHTTALERRRALLGYKEAKLAVDDTRKARNRADTDQKRGVDTIQQAQEQLAAATRASAAAATAVASAQKAATAATQKQGAAATTAQKKLSELSETERKLLTTFKTFSNTLSSVFRPATDAIFKGVDSSLGRLGPLFERYRGQFRGLGESIGGIIDHAAASLAGPRWTRALDSFIATTQKIVKPISNSIGSVLEILRDIAVAAQPYVIQLARGMERALGGLANKTGNAERMRDIIRDLAGHAESWGKFMGAVGRLIFTVFNGGAKDGQGLLDTLTKILNRWSDFLGTEEGQRRMREFFRDSIVVTKQLFRILGNIAEAFFDLSRWVQRAAARLDGFTDFVKGHKDMVLGLVGAWGLVKGAIIAANFVAKGSAAAAILTGGRIGGKAAAIAAGGAAAGGASQASGATQFLRKIPVVGKVAIGVGAVAAAASRINTSDDAGESGDKIDRQAKAIERFNRQLERLDSIGDRKGADKLAKQFDRLVDSGGKLRGSVGDVNRLTRAAKELGDQGGTLEKELRQSLSKAAERFDSFRRSGSNDMRGIRRVVDDNMNDIKKDLGTKSAAGREALARNFRLARSAIRDAMRDGKISVKDGLAEIQKLMRRELKAYGITGKVASSIIKHGDINPAEGRSGPSGGQRGGTARMIASGRRGRYFGGGWIGERGMIGEDTVPALLAPGEAVLNRHQQGAIEELLGDGFLDGLFNRVQRPHALQKGGFVQRFQGGGIVPVPGSPGESAARSVIPRIQDVLRRWPGLVLTDAYGQGHSSPGHTKFGTAADFSGPDAAMGAAVSALTKAGYLVGYDGTRGSQAWAGHGPSTRTPNFHFHVEFGKKAGKIVGGSAQGIMAAVKKIKAPQTGMTGALGGIVQGALDAGTRGANKRLEEAAASAVDTSVAGGGGGQYGKASGSVVSQFRRAISASKASPKARLALWMAGIVESGLRDLNYGDADSEGALQLRVGLHGRALARNPYGAARAFLERGFYGKGGAMALAKQNPGATAGWIAQQVQGSAYPDRYDQVRSRASQYMSRGGFLQAWKNLPGLVRAQKGRPGRSRLALGARATKPGLRFAGNREAQSGAIQRSVDRGELGITKYENDIKQMETEYGQQDRKYGLSEELLLIEQPDGSTVVDGNALAKRLGELDHLIQLRDRIRKKLEQYRKAVLELMTKLRREINKLKRLITAAKKRKGEGGVRERSGYQTQIETYEERITALRGIRGDLANEIVDSGLDIEALQIERASVAATKGEAAKVEDTPAETSADEQTQFLLEAANKQAAELAGQLKTTQDNLASLGGPGDIGGFRGGGNALGAVMAEVGGPGYGAARQQSLPGQQPSTSGGVNVTVNAQFLTPPSGSQLVQLGDSVVSALGARPAIPTTSATVG